MKRKTKEELENYMSSWFAICGNGLCESAGFNIKEEKHKVWEIVQEAMHQAYNDGRQTVVTRLFDSIEKAIEGEE